MTEKEFFNKVTNSSKDFLQRFIDLLESNKIAYCVIGGFGVNAYAEPLVSLDLDIIIELEKSELFLCKLKKHYTVKESNNHINITDKNSALRIQIQKDKRYQEFLKNAILKEVLGYRLYVASIENIFRGKVWAYLDSERRESKREKDLLDIKRLLEVNRDLITILPENIRAVLILKNH